MDRTWKAAVVVAIFLAAGCGGGDSGGTPETPGPGGPEVPDVPITPVERTSASSVVGQADFTSHFVNRGEVRPRADSFSNPFGPVAVLPGERFALPDWGNNRVLIFEGRLETGAEASIALGQPDLNSNGISVVRGSHPGPEFVAVGNDRLAVVNFDAHRVNIYNQIPTGSTTLPDVVVGQANFETADYGCDQRSLNTPNSAAWLPDGRLIVVDGANNRVLVYDNDWSASGKDAVLVLGQLDFDHCAVNDQDGDGIPESPTASTMNNPGGIWTDGTRLIVLDGGNNRVLIWTAFPTTSAQPADLVLGQPNPESAAAMPPSHQSLKEPYMGVDFDGVKLAISDTGNHRVLIWNSFPVDNHQRADEVIGQPAFDFGASNDSDGDGIEGPGPTSSTFSQPAGLKFYQGRLFVTDSLNHRVLVFGR